MAAFLPVPVSSTRRNSCCGVGWPTSAIFIDTFGWRGACLAWAALHLLIGLPMNRLLVPKIRPPPPTATHAHETASGVPWTMIVLASVFGATWFVSTAMAAHLPRLLQAMGSTQTVAVAAASLVGPAQVAARLVEFGLLRRLSPMISARLATGLHPIGATLLAIFGPVMAIPFVLLHGAGNGMLTIARGTVPLALQGGAPVLFGIVLDQGGPLYALLLSGTLTSLSFLALLTLSAATSRMPSPADG